LALTAAADTANIDAVIICDPQTDFYNQRNPLSIGCVFTTQLHQQPRRAILWLKKNNISLPHTQAKAVL
jgi:TrmH family RNA methyltransferase